MILLYTYLKNHFKEYIYIYINEEEADQKVLQKILIGQESEIIMDELLI